MSTKPRYPYAEAIAVAERLRDLLVPACERIEIVGSLRRRRAQVGDVEILYIGRCENRPDPDNMFGSVAVNLADEALERLQKDGVLAKRKNSRGFEAYGPTNKLMLDLQSGIPVDFFAATPETWWNRLVCRTGPAESNIRICKAALRQGWKWHPYDSGFSDERGLQPNHVVTSEKDAFDFVGLPYFPPELRK